MLKLNKDRTMSDGKLLICFNNIKINKTFKDIINNEETKIKEEITTTTTTKSPMVYNIKDTKAISSTLERMFRSDLP